MYKITNVEILLPNKQFAHGTLLLDGEHIRKVKLHEGALPCQGTCTTSADALFLDAPLHFGVEKVYAVPGLIDTHIHGAMGADLCDGTEDAVLTIAQYEASRGVTSLLPTTMTMDEETLKKAGRSLKKIMEEQDQIDNICNLLGAHMEGPFINVKRCGAQNPDFIRNPETPFYERLQEASGDAYKVVTLAPEVEGGMEFIDKHHKEISISVGHTCSDYALAKEAFDRGANRLTHCYNAMASLHHREPGPIAAAFDSKHTWVELICDGVHVDPAMVRLAFRLFGAERIIMISDSMRATAVGEGIVPFGGQEVEVKGREARLTTTGALAGSITDLMSCVRVAVKEMHLPLADVLTCASYNPAKALHVEDKHGSLEVGKFADLVLLNEELEPLAVWVKGKVIRSSRLQKLPF